MKPLLIGFPPGARGDFLAAVVLDLHQGSFAQPVVHVNAPLNKISHTLIQYTFPHTQYYKAHSGEDLTAELMARCLSIKIAVPTGTEADIIGQLMKVKPLAYVPGRDLVRADIASRLDSLKPWRFDYTINFRDLFKVNSVAAIYTQITKRKLTPERLAVIAQNIELQFAFLTDAERHYLSGRS